MTIAVTVNVAQRIASFCSLGISMIPSVASAGRKTISERRKTGVIFDLPYETRPNTHTQDSPLTNSLCRQARRPEKADQHKNRHRADHDEHHVLPDPPSL